MGGNGARPFWQTLPGILTGLAALLTAVGGLIGTLYATGVLGDGGAESTQTSTPIVEPSSEPSPAVSPSPSLATLQDLDIGEIRIESSTSPGYEYEIVATIINNGNGVADGFDIGATYRCLPGEQMNSAGLGIIQATYIMPKSTATYRTPFHYQCLAHPPSLALTVIVTDPEGQEKTFLSNPALPYQP